MIDFKYNGFATDWVGFKYEFEGKLHTVIREKGFREYIVTYPGSPELTASQCDLMNEYIKQLLVYKRGLHNVLDKLR